MADPIPDSFINEQASIGAKERDRATSGRPRFGMPDLAGSPAARDRLLGALMGFRSGMEAAQGMISQGNPVGAALMGMAGSMPTAMAAPEQVQAQRLQQEAQMRISQMSQMSLRQISEPLAAEYPEYADMDLGTFQVVAPILQRNRALEDRLNMFAARLQLDKGKPTVEDRETQKILAKEKLKFATASAAYTNMAPQLENLTSLNENSFGGIYGEVQQKLRSKTGLGTETEKYRNTAKVVGGLKAMVSKVLKSTFGGQLSDGEREYLNEVYGAADGYSIAERRIAIDRVRQMFENNMSESGMVLQQYGALPQTQTQKQAPSGMNIADIQARAQAELDKRRKK